MTTRSLDDFSDDTMTEDDAIHEAKLAAVVVLVGHHFAQSLVNDGKLGFGALPGSTWYAFVGMPAFLFDGFFMLASDCLFCEESKKLARVAIFQVTSSVMHARGARHAKFLKWSVVSPHTVTTAALP
ncbi:MAG: hypothetical protein AAFX06_29275 [Planctomycetota bacterium]